MVASSSNQAVEAMLADLSQEFTLKVLGTLHCFLGIEVDKIKEGIVLSQNKYASEIIRRLGMERCKPVNTPLLVFEKYSMHKETTLNAKEATKYRSMVGALQYLTLTKPYIAFSVNRVCQFLHAPTTAHMVVV
jgi:hypothetical protein